MQMIDLNGQWMLRQSHERKEIPAAVPGCVHLDLLAEELIPDPFYRDNERQLMWIGETDWVYSREFNVPAEVLERDRVLLQCEGLDTLATIRLNGRRLAATDNMHRTYEFGVAGLLKPGVNSIEIRFSSALRYGQEKDDKNPLRCTGMGHHKLRGGNHIRKEQCNFGWDWGPMCVTAGIWRPIHILAFDTARIADVHILQDHSRKGKVRLEVRVEAEKVTRAPLMASVTVALGGRTVATTDVPMKGRKATAELSVKNPELWWPNGMGAQPLYDVTVDLHEADGGLVDTVDKRIGLRTLRLVQEKDKWGESFRFEANGVPFFAKGANWIPADVFENRVTGELYETLLTSAATAHMNMIRVWGGGIYEEDVFYELCDELGICVWQDFMFACAAYPTDPEFMENVRLEAEDNVRRIRHHACLALYCGNNELEQIRLVNEDGSGGNMTWADYKSLFDKLLPSVVRKLDPQRDYIPSSEYTPGPLRKTDTRNPDRGDGHLWNVWHGREPFEWYRTAYHRFCSEFGFQSFPEPKTVETFTIPEDRNPTSRIMELHQRSGIGNDAIIQYMLSWYRLPVGWENVVWLSQIQQGLAIKYAVEHWRRNMPRCMGAIYWQLNDCWPAASWASIDSFGRWKALHFMAMHFFEPVLVTGLEDPETGTVEVHVSNDRLEVASGTLKWTVTNAAGRKLAGGSKQVKAPANDCRKVDTLRLSGLLAEHGAGDLLVWLELVVGGRTVSRNFVTFARPKHMELQDPQIDVKVKEARDGFRVTLKAARPALWAWLELPDGDLCVTDNFLCLRPGKAVTVTAWTERKLSAAQLQKKLRVRSIWDTYQE